MRIATVKISNAEGSPYSQGRAHQEPWEEKESHDAYERRTWRSKMHVTPQGFVFQPPMSYKNCLSAGARYLGMKIQGKRGATYTKHFESGLLVVKPVVLDVKAKDIEAETLFVPSDGIRGSGKRVWRVFPKILEWSGTVEFLILDDTITESIFETHLDQSGKFIGIGRFRPQNNGFYGRFKIDGKIKWSKG